MRQFKRLSFNFYANSPEKQDNNQGGEGGGGKICGRMSKSHVKVCQNGRRLVDDLVHCEQRYTTERRTDLKKKKKQNRYE